MISTYVLLEEEKEFTNGTTTGKCIEGDARMDVEHGDG